MPILYQIILNWSCFSKCKKCVLMQTFISVLDHSRIMSTLGKVATMELLLQAHTGLCRMNEQQISDLLKCDLSSHIRSS